MTDNVVNIGDLRIRHLEKKKPWDKGKDRCKHYNLTFDDNGSIVTCDDCSMQVSPYWALQMMSDHYDQAMKALERARAVHKHELSGELHLIAAKKVEKAWRSRNMVPTCPHCSRGILPEDGLGGSLTRREFEVALRKNQPGKKPGLPT